MLISCNWLIDYIGNDAPSPEEVEKLLTFYAFEIEGVEQVEGDTVIDIDILPNRSSDCLSHRGIARELATLRATPLAFDPLAVDVTLPLTSAISVDIEDATNCPRFTASLITGIEVKESPQWLKARLTAIGQRPINNIVDATNYVMYALGQPLHAYDAERFPQTDGAWQFVVRTAQEGEVVSLLAESGKDEDRDVVLDGTEILVVDGSTDTPIGLAGVKGGRFAGVHEGTTQVIVEAANWNPVRTRQTARRHGITTDAGKRFENAVVPELAPYAQEAIVALIRDIAGGTCEGVVDIYPAPRENPTVSVSVEKANALLGLSLEQSDVEDILTRVGCACASADGVLTVTGPFERTDLTIEEDLIEEIGRVYGYEHVASVVPKKVALTEYNARQFYGERIRSVLIMNGFSEVITSSFRAEDMVPLKNALASDKGCLRSSLAKNLEAVLEKNVPFLDLLGVEDIRVFEIGTVFSMSIQGVSEHVSLCLGVRRRSGKTTKEDEAVIEKAVGELTIALDANISFDTKDGVAELDLTQLLKALPEPTAYDPIEPSADVAYTPFSTYPHISRDIAMWTEDTTADEVVTVLNEHAGELRVRTTLFDEFEKDGRTSYAFRLVFQAPDRTLTDEEVNKMMEPVYAAVEERGWEVR